MRVARSGKVADRLLLVMSMLWGCDLRVELICGTASAAFLTESVVSHKFHPMITAEI